MVDMVSKVRSRAPLRLGFAGGGTDVSAFSDKFGGAVINSTISLYAHCTIEVSPAGAASSFSAVDINKTFEGDPSDPVFSQILPLHAAVHRRIGSDFVKFSLPPLRLITSVDAPPGSGLGSSSALVVAILAAYRLMFNLPIGEYELATLAYEIERVDCGFSGGKQDQFSATFGGFNYMEFYQDGRTLVNPLRIRRHIINELEESLVMFNLGTSRSSAQIIEHQISAVKNSGDSLKAMKLVKQSAQSFKDALLTSDLPRAAEIFEEAWQAKKNSSSLITNRNIQELEILFRDLGALSWKVSGAGGGGFMMIFVRPEERVTFMQGVPGAHGNFQSFSFSESGVLSWTI